MKKFLALSLLHVDFIMLINVKTIVDILTFMSRIKFVLSWVEHEKSFITLGPGPYNKSSTVLKCSKISNTSCTLTYIACRKKGLDKHHRVLLKKLSDQHLLGVAILACILWIQALITNIWFKSRKRKVFEIFEHLTKYSLEAQVSFNHMYCSVFVYCH